MEKNIFKRFDWKQQLNGEFDLTENFIKDSVNKISNSKVENKLKQMTIYDNNEKFKSEMTVMTEWGVGKILNVLDNGLATVRIEGNDLEFPLDNLKTSLTVYICTLCKDKTFWIEFKLRFDYNVSLLKQKISHFVRCHPYQIILVHNGEKVERNVNVFELGVYEKDVFLAIIKDPKEMSVIRCKNHITTNKNPIFNAIKFKCDHDVVLTGLGLYKNICIDLYYQVLIFEEDAKNNINLIFSDKNIYVKPEGAKENEIFKYKISNIEIKENVFYHIHQYLDKTDDNQIVGIRSFEKVVQKDIDVVFDFADCCIVGRTNSTDTKKGMIPMIYFYMKSEN